MCAGSRPEDARSDKSARSAWCFFFFTINFAVKVFHRGLSPLYSSCVMCAPSCGDAVIAAVPVPFTDRVGPDTHSSCIYLQFPLIWFDLRSKPVVIKKKQDLVCKIQRVLGRGLKSKVNRGRLPWRWGVRMAGPEQKDLACWAFVMGREASCGLPAQCLQDSFFFFFKPSVAKKSNADIWLTYCRVF